MHVCLYEDDPMEDRFTDESTVNMPRWQIREEMIGLVEWLPQSHLRSRTLHYHFRQWFSYARSPRFMRTAYEERARLNSEFHREGILNCASWQVPKDHADLLASLC